MKTNEAIHGRFKTSYKKISFSTSIRVSSGANCEADGDDAYSNGEDSSGDSSGDDEKKENNNRSYYIKRKNRTHKILMNNNTAENIQMINILNHISISY